MNRLCNQFFGLLTAAALVTGCGGTGETTKGTSTPPARTATDNTSQPHHDHVHGAGPHGGTLADWGGGQYHVEFTVDHDKQEATVYVLGSDEKTPTPIKAKDGEIQLSIQAPAFQIALQASPQEGDPAGSASRFVGKHEKLGKVQEFAGTITAEVDGTPFSGDFVEEPHDHDDHK